MISLSLFNKFQFVIDNSRKRHLQIMWAYEREMVNTLLKWPISLRINDKIILAQGYKGLHNSILLQEQCFCFNFSKICMRCVCGIFLFFPIKFQKIPVGQRDPSLLDISYDCGTYSLRWRKQQNWHYFEACTEVSEA